MVSFSTCFFLFQRQLPKIAKAINASKLMKEAWFNREHSILCGLGLPHLHASLWHQCETQSI